MDVENNIGLILQLQEGNFFVALIQHIVSSDY